jgi:hypothetical protein
VLDGRINTEERVFRVALNYKYAAWTAIDRLKRQEMCQRLLKKRDSKETEPAGNLALKIISTLEQLYSSESKETDKVLSSKLIAR